MNTTQITTQMAQAVTGTIVRAIVPKRKSKDLLVLELADGTFRIYNVDLKRDLGRVFPTLDALKLYMWEALGTSRAW